MFNHLIRRAVSVSSGFAIFTALIQLASADPLPCPVERAAGNCGVTRVGPDLKIEELAYSVNAGFTQTTVRGRGIGSIANGYQAHDVRWATVTIIPGGYSRWHYHPGANFTSVESGKGIYYTVEANGKCTTHSLSKDPAEGVTGMIEIPGQVHAIKNAGSDPLVLRVLFTKEEFDAHTGTGDPNFTEDADQPSSATCPTGFNP